MLVLSLVLDVETKDEEGEEDEKGSDKAKDKDSEKETIPDKDTAMEKTKAKATDKEQMKSKEKETFGVIWTYTPMSVKLAVAVAVPVWTAIVDFNREHFKKNSKKPWIERSEVFSGFVQDVAKARTS